MAAPAPNARRAAFAASLWQFPRRLVHPLVLTFLTAALFSYLAADTVRAACLLAVGLALAWDRARCRALPRSCAAGESGRGTAHAVTGFSDESAGQRRAAMGRLLVPAVAAAVAYSSIVGWLQRYSWPGFGLAGFRFPPDVNPAAARWHLRHGLSCRDAGNWWPGAA